MPEECVGEVVKQDNAVLHGKRKETIPPIIHTNSPMLTCDLPIPKTPSRVEQGAVRARDTECFRPLPRQRGNVGARSNSTQVIPKEEATRGRSANRRHAKERAEIRLESSC